MTRPLALVLQAVAVWLGGCSAAPPPERSMSIYECADDRRFAVHRDPYSAVVAYDDEHYNLSRRPSSVGMKYASSEATLIVDDQFAAFTSETVVDLKRCYVVK